MSQQTDEQDNPFDWLVKAYGAGDWGVVGGFFAALLLPLVGGLVLEMWGPQMPPHVGGGWIGIGGLCAFILGPVFLLWAFYSRGRKVGILGWLAALAVIGWSMTNIVQTVDVTALTWLGNRAFAAVFATCHVALWGAWRRRLSWTYWPDRLYIVGFWIVGVSITIWTVSGSVLPSWWLLAAVLTGVLLTTAGQMWKRRIQPQRIENHEPNSQIPKSVGGKTNGTSSNRS